MSKRPSRRKMILGGRVAPVWAARGRTAPAPGEPPGRGGGRACPEDDRHAP